MREDETKEKGMRRREFLLTSALARTPIQAQPPPRTVFQLACMTLPYSQFPFDRALSGIKSAGYRYVAWGVTHKDEQGRPVPALNVNAAPAEAQKLAEHCRGMGLEPVMMFSTVQLEAPNARDAHFRRIDQAAAAHIPFLLTFGKTTSGQYSSFIDTLKAIAPRARQAGVMVVIKQHGGNTATGADCARIVREVEDEGLKICYDAGNVLDYEKRDPIADIQTCWRDIRAFNIKDHRLTPKNEDCGPGFGEIDHYKLLTPVMRTGLTIPLTFENIFEPLVKRPSAPEGVDTLARRSREFIESVLRGLDAAEFTAVP
ncbi:MAG: sugar phosphate isomerase/epimerase [Acidobacteriota bacterium]|nr:sugar phosphate isomerase/epimerase [Acidobacteriota bacterium]